MHTQRPCVNKERYPFVLHLSSERQNWGPVHSCSHCAVSGHHQAGPIPKACTGRPAHSLTSGLHRRWSFPFYDFFFFFNLLPLVLYHSIYFCLCNSQSVFLPLSSLFSLLPWRGPQVVVTRERMMNSSTTEPADSLAAGPSPCSLHPLLTSSLFFFLSPHITSPLISVWQHYWMRELRDTYMCRGESQWTATHHNNLQVINQFWVSQSVNFMNENNPRCYSEIQYFVFVFSGMQKAALLFYIQIRATS